jgi:hypothetical protein
MAALPQRLAIAACLLLALCASGAAARRKVMKQYYPWCKAYDLRYSESPAAWRSLFARPLALGSPAGQPVARRSPCTPAAAAPAALPSRAKPARRRPADPNARTRRHAAPRHAATAACDLRQPPCELTDRPAGAHPRHQLVSSVQGGIDALIMANQLFLIGI